MTIRKRRLLFGSFVIAFLLLAPVIAFYANGTIFGSGWNILATGGIFIRSSESGTELYLNGKIEEKAGFFSRDYLLKNLRPNTYVVEVKKEGYNTWLKKITVHANLASDHQAFILPKVVPMIEIKKMLAGATSTATSSVIVGVNKPNPIYKEIAELFSATSTEEGVRSVVSTTTGKITKYALGTKQNPVKNGRLQLWTVKTKAFMGWDGSLASSPSFFCLGPVNDYSCSQTLEIYNYDQEIRKIDFFPGEKEVVIVAVGDSILAIEVESNPDKRPQIIFSGQKPTFAIDNGTIYIKDGDYLAQAEI